MRLHVFHLLVLSLAGHLAAQSLTTFTGSVQDSSGAPVDGAFVSLYSNAGTAPVAALRTGSSGRFSTSVPEGRYVLQARAPGFRQVIQVVEAAAGRPDISVVLDVDGVRQSVFVTAEASPQTIDEISKSTSLLDRTEIMERNEYSIAESLRTMPGIQIRNLGGPGQQTTLRARGLRSDAAAVLIDGFRFRDTATTQGDASSFFQALNIVNPGRIEVLHGSGSSLYGTNAVGGVVNVVTDPGGGSLHGDAQVEGGALGMLRGRTSAGGSALQNRLLYSGGLLHLNVMSGVDGNDRARSSGAQGFLRYALRPSLFATVRYWGSDDFVQPNASPTASGLPAANIPNTTIVHAIPNVTFIPSRDDPDNRRASRFHSAAFSLQQAPSARLNWQASYHRVMTDRTFQNGPAGPGFQPLTSNISGFNGSIDTADGRVTVRPTPWYALTAGYEFERESFLNSDDNREFGPSRVATRTTVGQDAHAGYVQNQFMLFDRRLQISVSGRSQTFRLRRPQFVTTGVANNYDTVLQKAPPRALTGDVAVSYFLPSAGLKLRAHGGNSYRAPALYERYGSGFYYDTFSNAVVFSPYGDPRLAPDRYNSFDAGIDQYLLRDKVRFSGTYFYTRMVQLIAFDSAASVVNPATDPFLRFGGYFNGSGGMSRGVELETQVQPRRGTMLRGTYTHTNVDNDRDLQVRGFFTGFTVPAHTFTFTANQQLGRRTSFNFDLYRASEYFNPLSAAGRARAYRYPGITKADFVISRQLNRSENRPLFLYVKVDNFLNQEYFENGFRSPRATWVTGLRVSFQ